MVLIVTMGSMNEREGVHEDETVPSHAQEPSDPKASTSENLPNRTVRAMVTVYAILFAILAVALSIEGVEPLRVLAIEAGIPSSHAFAFPVVIGGTAILVAVLVLVRRDGK